MNLAWIALCGAALAAKGPPTTSLLKDKQDLNGDGKADKFEILEADAQDGLHALKIVVNGVSLSDKQLYKDVTVKLVDVEPADKAQQIFVDGTSQSGKKWYTFFVWDGHKIVEAWKMDTGSASGAVELVGAGTVIVSKPKGFWTQRTTWHFEPGNAFVESTQPFYYIGMQGSVANPCDVYHDPGSSVSVATLGAGDAVEIVIVTTADKPWYLIKTPKGILGWVDGAEIGKSITPGAPATEAS